MRRRTLINGGILDGFSTRDVENAEKALVSTFEFSMIEYLYGYRRGGTDGAGR